MVYTLVTAKATHSGWGYVPKISFPNKDLSIYGIVLFELKWKRHHIYLCKKEK